MRSCSFGLVLACWSLTAALSPMATAQESQPAEATSCLAEYQNRVEAADLAESISAWPQAAVLYNDIIRDFRPFDTTLRLKMARAWSRCEEYKRALVALTDAVKYGYIDFKAIESADEFRSLRSYDEFRSAINRARELSAEQITVVVPEGLDKTKPAPVVIAFHGRGTNNIGYQWHWRDAAQKAGAILIVPRGPRALTPAEFAWDAKESRGSSSSVDVPAAMKLVEQGLESARKLAALDESKVVLVGFSEGGGVAIRIAAESPARFTRVIAVSPLVPETPLAAVRSAARKPKVHIFTGELDRLRTYAERARDEWAEAGAAVTFVENKDAAHDVPPDFATLQLEALQSVLKD